MNRRILIVAVGTALSSALAGSLAFAADAPKRVEREAKQLFPDREVDIQSGRQINGVQTFDVAVQGRNEDSAERASAVLTENGDVVMSSQRRTDGAPTPSVERVAKGLFNMPMDEYQAVTQTFYLVDTALDGNEYQLKIDATGRIRDAQTARRVRLEDVSSLQKAENADRDAVTKFVQQWHEGAQVGEVYRYEPISNYFLVEYTPAEEGAEPSQIIMNRAGRVYQEVTKISQDDLPRTVRATVDELIEGAEIQDAMRADINYYEFQRSVGDDRLTVRIRPNGEIVQVRSQQGQEADEEARTASDRQEREE